MIEVQVKDVVNSIDTLREVVQRPLKARTAFNVAKLIRSIDGEYELYNTERDKLIKKYGNKDENGELIVDENGRCRVADEDIPKFNEEIQELLNNEVTINAPKLYISELGEETFTPMQMLSIEKFLESEE